RLPPSRLSAGGNIVKNGYFSAGLTNGWGAASNGVAALAVSRVPSWQHQPSLLVRGAGRTGRGSTVVEQVFDALPAAGRGTTYDFGFIALRRQLSRTMIAWMKLTHLDGSYQAVLVHRLAGGPAAGIAPGSDSSWQAYGASARASK